MRTTFDPTTGVIEYRLVQASASVMWLFDWFKTRLAITLNLKVIPITVPANDMSTISARVLATAETGVSELFIDMDGDFTPAALTARVGLNWTLPSQQIMINAPKLHLTVSGDTSLQVTGTTTIASVSVTAQPVQMLLKPGPTITIQVGPSSRDIQAMSTTCCPHNHTSACTMLPPCSHCLDACKLLLSMALNLTLCLLQFTGDYTVKKVLAIRKPLFRIVKGVGYVLDATNASFAGVSGQVSGTLTLGSDDAAYTFKAANSPLGDALKGTANLIGIPVPQFMADFVNGIIFSEIVVDYGREGEVIEAELEGHPLVTKDTTPLLYYILQLTKSTQEDLVLTVSKEGIALGLSKTWTFTLPTPPFTNPPGGSSVNLFVGFIHRPPPELPSFGAMANFTTGLTLPGPPRLLHTPPAPNGPAWIIPACRTCPALTNGPQPPEPALTWPNTPLPAKVSGSLAWRTPCTPLCSWAW
jgi:hypothetical protein